MKALLLLPLLFSSLAHAGADRETRMVGAYCTLTNLKNGQAQEYVHVEVGMSADRKIKTRLGVVEVGEGDINTPIISYHAADGTIISGRELTIEKQGKNGDRLSLNVHCGAEIQ